MIFIVYDMFNYISNYISFLSISYIKIGTETCKELVIGNYSYVPIELKEKMEILIKVLVMKILVS